MTASPSTDLASWLLDRLAEDEAAARAAHNPPWRIAQDDEDSHFDVAISDSSGRHLCVSPDDGVRGGHEKADAEHIARHDPARVLGQVAAIRQVVELHSGDDHECEEELGPMVFDAEPEVSVGTDSFGGLVVRQSIGYTPVLPCPTLRALASIWADAPGYGRWGK